MFQHLIAICVYLVIYFTNKKNHFPAIRRKNGSVNPILSGLPLSDLNKNICFCEADISNINLPHFNPNNIFCTFSYIEQLFPLGSSLPSESSYFFVHFKTVTRTFAIPFPCHLVFCVLEAEKCLFCVYIVSFSSNATTRQQMYEAETIFFISRFIVPVFIQVSQLQYPCLRFAIRLLL